MSVFFRPGRYAALSLVCAMAAQGCTAPTVETIPTAKAALTAEDVWSDLQARVSSEGYALTGVKSASGDVTVFSDVTMSGDFPLYGLQFQMIIPDITLTENDDGTVAIGWPEHFPITLSGQMLGESFSAAISHSQDRLNVSVSGSPGDMTYDYAAAGLGLTLDGLDIADERLSDDVLDVRFQVNELDGRQKRQVRDNHTLITETFKAAGISWALRFEDPESGGSGIIDGTLKLDRLTSEGEIIIPDKVDMSNPLQALKAGFALSSAFTYGAGEMSANMASEAGSVSIRGAVDGGRFISGLDARRITYDTGHSGVRLKTTENLSLPTEIAIADAELQFEFPLQKSEDLQPFGFALNLTDFTLSDSLWDLFDPAGALPRDPATLALDAAGMVKVLMDIFDPGTTTANFLTTADAAPGELHALKINEVLISLIGAELTGEGEFAFNPSNTDRTDDLPFSSGMARLQLAGASTLINKLTSLDLLSDDQALSAQMLIAMTTDPDGESDKLEFTIEFTEDAQILLNGHRIR